MGLIRLLILAALIYIVWRFYQSLRAPRRAPGTASPPPAPAERMVKCRQCGLHVPEKDAFLHRDLGFCSQEHQRLYLESHGC